MQKFTYHTHTNSFGYFDGANSVQEMVDKAEELGLEEIGISNHLICNPKIANISRFEKMYMTDYNKALDIYKAVVAEIKDVDRRSKIKVYAGFEVDFFAEGSWQEFFQKAKEELKADYYIGASHFVDMGDFYSSFSYLSKANLPDAEKENIVKKHFINLEKAVRSKNFSFIAHFDQAAKKSLAKDFNLDKEINLVADALIETKTPYEISTKGFRKFDDFMPSRHLIEKLCAANVPVVISDDAHTVSQLTENFALANLLITQLKYNNIFKLKKEPDFNQITKLKANNCL